MIPLSIADEAERSACVEIRVRGLVQGVGFRPTVWRFAQELGLRGEVLNDSEGVLIRVAGRNGAISRLVERLRQEPPPLARIERIERRDLSEGLAAGFRIGKSVAGSARTEIAPDAVVCPACADEVFDPFQRRYRYAFANCTHCGPRLSIIRKMPFDRSETAMASFPLCQECLGEYHDPADRRFHAEAIACHACGPKPALVRCDGRAISFDQFSILDAVDAACSLLLNGHILAVKGLGGYQLACDATNADTVLRLRKAKMRDAKPFALMARDLAVVRRYCTLSSEEEQQLASSAGPIVLMRADGPDRLPDTIAPGLRTLGFMLPTTPLHLLALRRMSRPVVMTSGNASGEPPITDDGAALRWLADIADYVLVHDRPIINRVDDSVVRVMGGVSRMLRRSRGFAPVPIALPAGFASSPDLLAFGGELKSTFCLVKDGNAILSQHIGDLENAATYDDFRRNLSLFAALFDHAPRALAADLHPEYLSSKLARAWIEDAAAPLLKVQHHHAHIAACLVDNGRPMNAPPVLGIVLDGLGWGDNETIWGGEFLLADYRRAERLGTFKPVAMPGGGQAAREPWRNLYAHLTAEMSWAEFAMNFAELDVFRYLESKPRATLDAMIRNCINAPLASSCGRLFDAVAAALDTCRDWQGYEGEAAARLESLVCERTMQEEDEILAYPFTIPRLRGSGLPYIEPLAMWRAILGDLTLGTPAPVIAARFHKGLAKAIVGMAKKLVGQASGCGPRFDTVALSGGCFQNAVLLAEIARRLEAEGFTVLSHSNIPSNDGGISLGQAAVAAAQLIDGESERRQGDAPCASAFQAGS
jgi:hydrogenase maturation protein HypF